MSTALIRSRTATEVAAGAVTRIAGLPVRSWRAVAFQLVRFAGVGTFGMGLYLGLFVLGQQITTDPVANVTAWLVSTLATNQAHRSLTFGVRDRQGATADQTVSLLTSIISLVASTFFLSAFPGTGTVDAMAILVAVNVVVGAARFVLLRWWIVGHRSPETA